MNRTTRSFDRRRPSELRTTGTEAPQADRHAMYRERAPGVGYGNSSGYASGRTYASGWSGYARFRCS